MFVPPKYLTIKDEIYDKLDEIDIYEHYLDTKINKISFTCLSPLRKEKHNSFSLYYKNSKILWKDFTLNIGGDIFNLISYMYNINYFEAQKKILNDLILNRSINFSEKKIYAFDYKEKTSNIDLIFLYYLTNNIPNSFYNYWNKYKVIDKNILEKNNVKCVKYVYLNSILYATYKDNDILIGYNWKRKNIDKIFRKLYRPLNKEHKWLSNFRGSSKYLIHGLDRIDKNVDYLIITKSVKDKMVLEGLGFNSVNIQNEGISIPDEILMFLHNIYKNIYIFYDNDYNKSQNWGQIESKKLIKQYPFIKNIKIDNKYECTDISEFIEKYDIDKTSILINKSIN